MADNYLEKRMEELRSGKTASKAPHTGSIANTLQFAFPSKRILIINGFSAEGYHVAESFRRAGSRVSFMSEADNERDESYIRKAGDAGYMICRAVSCESLTRTIKCILSQWRSIDIIIDFGSGLSDKIIPIIRDYLNRQPSHSDYQTRTITVEKIENDKSPVTIQIQSDVASAGASLPSHTFHIRYTQCYDSCEQLKRMIQFLSLPEVSFLLPISQRQTNPRK